MIGQLFRGKTTAVWLLLIFATIVSWQVGTHGGSARVSAVIVMAVAFVKIRFVGLWFMELRVAPLPLRALFEAYVVCVGVALIVLYLVA